MLRYFIASVIGSMGGFYVVAGATAFTSLLAWCYALSVAAAVALLSRLYGEA